MSDKLASPLKSVDAAKLVRPPARVNKAAGMAAAAKKAAGKKATNKAHNKPAAKKIVTKPAGKPHPPRQDKEKVILDAAEQQFAHYGFEGVSLESIAAAVGVSRHNLLYYFPSKDALYHRVLDRVMDLWLESMARLSASDNPQEALSAYIAAKLKFSHDQPTGSQVFTREVAAGAPRYAEVIEKRVAPMLRKDIKTLEKWAKENRIARIDYTHLMFAIWSVTQAYADLAPQFAMLLGKPRLEEPDFVAAQKVLTHLVLEGLRKRG